MLSAVIPPMKMLLALCLRESSPLVDTMMVGFVLASVGSVGSVGGSI